MKPPMIFLLVHLRDDCECNLLWFNIGGSVIHVFDWNSWKIFHLLDLWVNIIKVWKFSLQPHQIFDHTNLVYIYNLSIYNHTKCMRDQSHLSNLYNLQPHQICDHTKLTDTLSTYNHINFLTTPNWCSCTTRHTLSNHTKCDHTKYDHTKSLLTDSLQPQ